MTVTTSSTDTTRTKTTRTPSPLARRPPLGLLAALASAISVTVALRAASAQPPPAAATPPAAAEEAAPQRSLPPGRFLGAATCGSANCHGSVDPVAGSSVMRNEFLLWIDGDPHATAYGALFAEESELIARNLRLEKPAYESAVCLDCHTLNPARRLQGNPLSVEEGISCEGCHGPASGWIAGHVEADWSHADSVRRGMRDLRVVSERAVVCMDCHLGNAERKVDHELIAAGHPELLFELDNFTGTIPQHWLPYGESHRQAGRKNTHGVRTWALGQVASFRAGLDQLARRAESDRWPEFADMACTNCHHSIDDGDRARQQRGFPLRAGLPAWSPARWAVLRHLVRHYAAGELARLDEKVREMAATVAYMNRPQETARLAREIATALGPVEAAIESVPLAASDAQALIRALASDRAYLETTDVQSAEQVLFAINSLISHLETTARTPAHPELERLIAKLDAEVTNRRDFAWERFNGTLGEIAGALR